MTAQEQFPHSFHSKSLIVRTLQGAGLAFVLLLVFMLSTGAPADVKLLSPFGTVTLAGACGGIFYYLTDEFRYQGGWKKVTANIVCALTYIAGLYLGLVFGLSLVGYWN